MKTKFFITLSAGLIISGCGMSPKTYEAGQALFNGSPAVRSDFINSCTQRIRAKPLKTRQVIANVANTSLASAPKVYCTRFVKGVASGRLTLADINAIKGGTITPTMIKVVQGR